MGLEIERKFLVSGTAYRDAAKGVAYRQGYLNREADRTVRVRIAGELAYVTVKGRAEGIARHEFEYAIPMDDAVAMLDKLCLRPLIEKTRYDVMVGGLLWVVDEFKNENAGLVLAEVELPSEDHPYTRPPWCGAEVTHDQRYTNSALSAVPYSTW